MLFKKREKEKKELFIITIYLIKRFAELKIKYGKKNTFVI